MRDLRGYYSWFFLFGMIPCHNYCSLLYTIPFIWCGSIWPLTGLSITPYNIMCDSFASACFLSFWVYISSICDTSQLVKLPHLSSFHICQAVTHLKLAYYYPQHKCALEVVGPGCVVSPYILLFNARLPISFFVYCYMCALSFLQNSPRGCNQFLTILISPWPLPFNCQSIDVTYSHPSRSLTSSLLIGYSYQFQGTKT